MASRVDELADEIASLDESVQQAIWEHVIELNLRRGVHDLSERYCGRLRAQGDLDRTADQVLADLARTREEVAASDRVRLQS